MKFPRTKIEALLTHGNFPNPWIKRGLDKLWLVATNGFSIAFLPLEQESPGEVAVEGTLPTRLLTLARDALPGWRNRKIPSRSRVSLTVHEGGMDKDARILTTQLSTGETITVHDPKLKHDFPEIQDYLEMKVDPEWSITINLKELEKLCQALGGSHAVTLTFSTDSVEAASANGHYIKRKLQALGLIRVTPRETDDERFGVIMPMKI